MLLIYLLIAIVVMVIIWGISTYNKLVAVRENVANSKGQIAAQIESRWDALTSIIQATKQYAKHEADTLEKVTAQRTSVSENSSVATLEKDDAQFAGVLDRLIAVAEAYPELKASNLYQEAMRKINDYENNVRHSRMIYNDTVTKLNRSVQQFPTSVIAGMFNFSKEPYFEETPSKQEMPSWE